MDPFWEPEGGEDPETIFIVRQAAGRFREELGPDQLVLGVGAAAFAGRAAPLLLVDEAQFPQLPQGAGEPWPLEGRVAPTPAPVLLGQLPSWPAAVKAGRAPGRLADAPSTVVLPVTPPQPLGTTFPPPLARFPGVTDGATIRGATTLMRGTAGPSLTLSCRSAMLRHRRTCDRDGSSSRG
jgi:hypothetical protein